MALAPRHVLLLNMRNMKTEDNTAALRTFKSIFEKTHLKSPSLRDKWVQEILNFWDCE